ncbi:hypothetical protein ACX0G7_09715 [Flavitalea antarctica]
MKVKDLLKMLQGIDPEMSVLISHSGEFDGVFLHPCLEESGVTELGLHEDSDETEKSFVLVRCGFFNEHEGVPPELN